MDKPSFELRILGPTELIGPAPGAGEAIVRQLTGLALFSYLALTTADGLRCPYSCLSRLCLPS